jgi:hypothetical protein
MLPRSLKEVDFPMSGGRFRACPLRQFDTFRVSNVGFQDILHLYFGRLRFAGVTRCKPHIQNK